MTDSATRRLLPILSHLRTGGEEYDGGIAVNFQYANGEEEEQYSAVSIGNITLPVLRPAHPHLVPFSMAPHYSGVDLPLEEIIMHLKWMFQKAKLRQDMFLIGPPGPMRRWITMKFCDMTKREVEYVALNRDTTEADLKQRREISGRSVVYIDQAAVKAALYGRILILDGIEKCERNVLPVLNNLLENREMLLEDGRFLVSAKRFDTLLKTHSEEELKNLKLVKVHQNFQVIALGLPVPRFEGNLLDPPLRSRFQARDVRISAMTQYQIITSLVPDVSQENVKKLINYAEALRTMQNVNDPASAVLSTSKMLYLADSAILDVCRVLALFPHASLRSLLFRVHPVELTMDSTERQAIEAALATLQVTRVKSVKSDVASKDHVPDLDDNYIFVELKPVQSDGPDHVQSYSAVFKQARDQSPISVPVLGGHVMNTSGTIRSDNLKWQRPFIETPYFTVFISTVLQDHAIDADICLIGAKGSGKTALIDEFSKKLNYNTFTIQLYKDMSARDLLQRRSTNQRGDTVWIDSPIVQAAKSGSLIVLDGIHRLAPGTLSILQRLIHERELTLPDGSYLMRSERYDALVRQLAKSNDSGPIESVRTQLTTQKIFAVHPSFRIIALAEPPGKLGPARWLNSEISSMFHFHILRGIGTVDKFQMLEKMFPGLQGRSREAMKVLFELVAKLDQYSAAQNRISEKGNNEQLEASLLYSDVPQLSLRQLIRICKKISTHPNDMYNALENTLLVKFLPIATRRALEQIVSDCGAALFVQKRENQEPIRIIVDEKSVRIDEISCSRSTPKNPALVPDILFFEVPKHVEILKEMLKDYQLGEHILLIGNQGVGKNVLSDKLLQLLRIEREYIQLHRDTTVQTLTLFPSIHNGVLVWEDSPLVRAVREGRTLVVDEADKAPLEVVIILKGLVEDCEMLLSDGRRILRLANYSPEVLSSLPENIVPMHPEFRMIVLANRPGFPFLGNNFFRECGDCFSSHIVDNPDRDSEIKLLQGYGPHVDLALVQRLVSLFGDLRSSVDQGLLSYPYSLRELVNIVKHLEAFPNDTISQTIENVFDFDNYDSNLKQYLGSLFNRHGIPLTGGSFNFKVKLADEIPLPRPIPTEVIKKKQIGSDVTMPLDCPAVTAKLEPKGNWPYEANQGIRNKSLMQSRAQTFTEEVCNWQVETKGSILGMTHTSDGRLHVLVTSPFQVLSYAPSFADFETLQLADHMHFSSPAHSYANIYAHSENSEIMGTQTDDSIALYRSSGGISSSSVWRFLPPAAIISALDDDSYVLFIASLNMVIKIDPIRKLVQPYALPDLSRQNSGPLFAVFGKRVFANVRQPSQPTGYSSSSQRQVFMLDGLATKGILVFMRKYSTDFAVMNFARQQSIVVSIPIEDFEIETIQFIETNWWLVIEKTRKNVLLNWKQAENKFELYFIDMKVFHDQSREDLYKTIPTTIREHYFASLNTIPNYFNNIYTYLQYSANPFATVVQNNNSSVFIESYLRPMEDRKRPLHSQHLRKSNQIINVCLQPENPEGSTKQERGPKLVLEILDLEKKIARSLEILPSEAIDPSSKLNSTYLPVTSTTNSRSELFKIVALSELPNGDLVTIQENGHVRVWEVDVKRLNLALKQWQKIIGQDLVKSDNNSLKVTYDYDGKKEATGPKYGIVDPTGESHTGGNTWAGGTGGANTAGMGGKGGPFRLDAGHNVAQISKEEKSKVSKEVAEAARAMAKAALDQRLREINMTEYEAQKYIRYVAPVQFEIKQLRAILEAAQAKGKEREWGRMKSTGELDDTRLVEGITGDRNVYKVRENQKPRFGSPQEKPKRMRFVMDISGSMYRFNSQDKRLDRLLQVTAMIMESLQGFEQKFSYSIVGHSGDSPEIPLVEYDKPPKDPKERLQILEKMSAHSQYCSSGDTTVTAAQWAIRNVAREEADEHFVFVFSDANLSRYDIKPQDLAIELMRDVRVRAYAIFIASFVDEAEQLKKGLPLGRGYVCLDPGQIPSTFKQIFAEQTLDSDY